MVRKKLTLSTTQIILLSFLATILLGSILLVLPISSADGVALYVISADAVRLYTDENTQNSLASSYDFSLKADSMVEYTWRWMLAAH